MRKIPGKWFKRAFLSLSALFIVTFLARWAYEVYFSGNDVIVSVGYAPTPENYGGYDAYEVEGEAVRKTSSVMNIASEKITQKDYTGAAVVLDQKYEKNANLSAQTDDFDKEDATLRQIVTTHEAVIQSENLNGLEGSRGLYMKIGVKPDNFDALVEDVKKIGTIQSFTVNKVDKTDEFRMLMAEQEILKLTRDRYLEIKKMSGDVQDMLMLEEKILEVENKLQMIGVDAGLFSSENSLCTVNFSLTEYASATHSISVRFVLSCAKAAFFWTMLAFAAAGALAIGALFMVWLALFALAGVLAARKEEDAKTTLTAGITQAAGDPAEGNAPPEQN